MPIHQELSKGTKGATLWFVRSQHDKQNKQNNSTSHIDNGFQWYYAWWKNLCSRGHWRKCLSSKAYSPQCDLVMSDTYGIKEGHEKHMYKY